MLYKDGEKLSFSKTMEKDIEEFDPKKGMNIIYPKTRVKKSITPDNTKPDKPNSISFPLTAIVNKKGVVEKYTYCESAYRDNNGNLVFTPASFAFKGKTRIEDKELYWWFKMVCPYCDNGENFKGGIPKCHIENKAQEAREEVKRKSNKVKFEKLLYDEDLSLDIEKLRLIGKAYFIPGIDDMSEDEVRLAIETKVHQDRLNGVETFLKMANADNVLKTKAILQNAIDGEKIYFHIKGNEWCWKTEPGQKKQVIFKVPVGTNENEALYQYYISNVKFAKELVAVIQGAPFIEDDEI